MEQYVKKQLKEGYNADLNKLFEEWKASYEAKEQHLFCEDGLIVKYKDENSGYDINEKWRDAERKIMFIVKDCPNGWGNDTRRLLVGNPDNAKSIQNADNTRKVKGSFFRNIAKLLYGLSILTEENKGVEDKFEIVDKKVDLIKVFNEIPFAFVEAKKQAGKKICPDEKLHAALKRDGEYFAQEISILRPNIIICCDKNEIIFNNVVQNYFNGKIPDKEHKWGGDYIHEGQNCGFDYKLYYYEEEGVLLFNSFHPSDRIAKWKIYEKVLSPFRQFFEKYKTFDIISATSQKE